MAEILGAVASGLAVAEVGLKAGGTVWKLKKLWQEVHDVPTTIQDLMRQIETMDPVLSDHESTIGNQNIALPAQLPTYNAAPAMMSAAYCREALNDLRRLVEDLDVAIESEKRSRRTLARMRVVLKKDAIKGFQDRLERAMRLLQSTQLSYLAANATITGTMVTDMWTAVTNIQAQQQLILQQLTSSSPSSSTGRPPFPVVTQHEVVVARHTPVKGTRAQVQKTRVILPWPGPCLFGAIVVRKSDPGLDGDATYTARIQLPKWLSQRVWDISVNRACSGWQGSLCTWNIVPHRSPGMLCAMTGNIEGLLYLFSRGLASPQDCNISGRTIFHMACVCSQTHVVQRLIEMNLDRMRDEFTGADAWEMMNGARLSIGVMRPLISQGFFEPLSNAAQDFEVLTSSTPPNPSHDASIDWISLVTTSEDVFELYLQTCFPFWHTLKPRRKQEILTLIPPSTSWTVKAVRLLFCPSGTVQANDTRTWIDDEASFLHMVLSIYFGSCRGDATRDWHALLQESITATDDLHHMLKPVYPFGKASEACSALKSALMRTMNKILTHYGRSPHDKRAQLRLKQLTVDLQYLMSIIASCGHDLLEFGRREAAIWVGQDDTCRIAKEALVVEPAKRVQKDRPQWFFLVIHYGPEPMHWYFEQEIPQEDYAGDFWALVERPPPTPMPGAWVDDDFET